MHSHLISYVFYLMDVSTLIPGYMQPEINIKVGNKAPKDYFDGIAAQCSGGAIQYGAIYISVFNTKDPQPHDR